MTAVNQLLCLILNAVPFLGHVQSRASFQTTPHGPHATTPHVAPHYHVPFSGHVQNSHPKLPPVGPPPPPLPPKLCLIPNYHPCGPSHYPQKLCLIPRGPPLPPPPARHVGPPLSPKLCLIPNSVPFSGQLNLELVRTFWPLTNTNKN